MSIRAGRIGIAAAFVFSTFLGISQAQNSELPRRTITPQTPATPFERTLRPLLDQLRAANAKKPSTAATVPADSLAAGPNFGGYLNGVSYPARAATSIQYDSLNNGVNVVLTADFDNDGHPDVAVIQSDGILNILHNNGSGVLSAPVGYINPNPNVGSSFVESAYAVDLNGDGYLDVVAYDSNDGLLLTFMNDAGTFSAAQTTTINTSFGNIAGINVGDMNGDGKADVVVAYFNGLSRTSSQMTVQSLISKGDGTFTAGNGQTFNVSASLQLTGFSPVALGDLNGDGKLDIAALFLEQTGRSSGNFVVTTALGNGDGTFGTLGTNSVIADSWSQFGPPSETGVQILDINNDGKNDVLTAAGLYLYVALGNGDNTFATPVKSTFAGDAAMVFADVNGDGKPDVISGGSGVVSIYLGKGDGTFAAPSQSGQYIADPPVGTQELAVADLDGDNKLDVIALSDEYKEVTPLLGNGDGTLRAPQALSVPSDSFPFDTVLETVLTDSTTSYSDLIVANFGGTNPAVLTGISDGKGNFNYINSLPGGVPSGFDFIEPIQADFNGDGKQDLLIVGIAGGLWVALANGDGTFQAPAAITMPSLACPVQLGAAGDLNGDKKLDIVVAYPGDAPCAGTSYASGYFVIMGNGDGSFQKPTFYPAGSELYSATLADINADGNLDLFLDDLPPIATGGYQVTEQLGNGDGTFGAPNTLLSNYIVSDVKVADLTGDGKPDVLLSAEELDGSDVSTGGLFLINGNGDGTFGARTQIAGGNWFFNTAIADLNGDSIPDIAATLYSTDGQPNTYYGFVTLLGEGNGSFSAPYNQLESFDSSLPLVGNFFNDNAPDVAVETAYGAGVYLGQGGTTFTLGTSAASVAFGSGETLTATLGASMANRPTPTGSVTFSDNGAVLGTVELSSGVATYGTSALATGSHSITAAYSGDDNFNPQTSSTSTVTVTALPPVFTLTGTPGTLSLNNGSNGIVTLGFTANASFNGTISLACSGAPTNASCGFNTNSVTLTPAESTTATLVVGTTANKAANEMPAPPWQHGAPLMSLAGVAAVFVSRRRRTRFLAALPGLMIGMAILGMVGCGSSGTSVKAVGKSTFTITVTATPSDSSVAAQSTSVSVTVQ
jgi:Big-like domain-containing protein/VCBS repeat protein